MFTYIDILQLPIVHMDISERTVKNNVLFQVLDTAVNKDVSVVNPGVTFLLDAIMNKTASYSLKTEKVKTLGLIIFSSVFFFLQKKRKLIMNLTDHNAFKLPWTFE